MSRWHPTIHGYIALQLSINKQYPPCASYNSFLIRWNPGNCDLQQWNGEAVSTNLWIRRENQDLYVMIFLVRNLISTKSSPCRLTFSYAVLIHLDKLNRRSLCFIWQHLNTRTRPSLIVNYDDYESTRLSSGPWSNDPCKNLTRMDAAWLCIAVSPSSDRNAAPSNTIVVSVSRLLSAVPRIHTSGGFRWLVVHFQPVTTF